MRKFALPVLGLLSTLTFADHAGSPVQGQPLIIDVRTANEYQQEHVRQSVNIPYNEIAQRIAHIATDRDTRIVLYCRSGRRSGIAEQTLRQLGYRQVENRGGLHDMQRSGYRTN